MGMTLPLFVEDRRLILQKGWTRETLGESGEVNSVRPSFPLPRTSGITNVSPVSLNLLFWTLHVNEIMQYVTFVTVCFDLE